MARQRNTGGYNPYSYGMNRVGQQDLFDPEFANIDFADFQGLDMNLINQNARFAQEVANKRLDELREAQTKLLDDIKLNKRFDYVEKDLQNKVASVIQNAGNVQLSDAANFTNLNSNLISLKTDPNLKRIVYSSEQARKAQEILDKDPNLKNRPWDAPMYNKYQAFLNGETNDFELEPIYKDVDMVAVWDDFYKGLPKAEQDDLQKYGAYGLVQAKTEGRNVDELIRKIEDFKNNTIKNNIEVKSHLDRRSNYAAKTLGVDPNQWQDEYLKESINAAASKYAQVNRTLGSVGTDPNASMNLQWAQENRMQKAQDKQDELTASYDFQGGVLVKGGKPVKGSYENDAFKQTIKNYIVPQDEKVNVTTSTIVDGKTVTKTNKRLLDPNSIYITTINGQNVLRGKTKKGNPIDPIPVPSDIMLNVLNNLGQSTVTNTPPSTTSSANMQNLFNKYNLTPPTN
jgi:hypothetical protein